MEQGYSKEELEALNEGRAAILQSRQAIDDQMLNTFDAIEKLIPRAKMAESVFRRKYLKFLSSVPLPEDEIKVVLDELSRKTGRTCTPKDLQVNLINEWISDTTDNSTGSGILCETDVYNEEGQIIFTVPAFAHSTDIPEQASDLIVKAAIEAGVTYHTDILRANQIISTRIAPLMPKRTDNKAYTAAWNKIYQYYELPLLGEAGNVVTAAKPVDDCEDLFDY